MCNFCDDDWHDRRVKMLEQAAWKDWEEVPHRKKGGYKKKKKADHKHLMAQESVETVLFSWKPGSGYVVYRFNCIICEDKPTHRYDWNYKK